MSVKAQPEAAIAGGIQPDAENSRSLAENRFGMTPVEGARLSAIKSALFRGERLHMGDATYRVAVAELLEALFLADLGAGDLTVEALALAGGRAGGQVIAKEPGIVAGLEELEWLVARGGVAVRALKNDGEAIERGDVVVEIEGPRGELLAYERTGLNLLQRMSGIATVTKQLQERVQRKNPNTFLVATRKTPWGLLDKRAVHLGGGGTHRLDLHDAILIKNNHLTLLASREDEAVVTAIERAWAGRNSAAFVEVEVRSTEAAVAAAQAFRRVRAGSGDAAACPCLLLLDNMSPAQARETLNVLQSEGLRETDFRPGCKYSPDPVVEVSGAISESSLDEYASCGADALSMGALTHSSRALDLSLRIS